MGANDKIRWFSICNIVVLISGLFVTLSCACGIRFKCANPKLVPPSQLSHFITMKDSLSFMCATSCAFVGVVSASIVLWFESLLIRNQFHKSVGYGFWFTVAILAVYGIFFIIMFTLVVYSACDVHRKVRKPGVLK